MNLYSFKFLLTGSDGTISFKDKEATDTAQRAAQLDFPDSNADRRRLSSAWWPLAIHWQRIRYGRQHRLDHHHLTQKILIDAPLLTNIIEQHPYVSMQ